MPDVVLIRPPYDAGRFDQLSQEPLGLEYVCAALRGAGYDVEILDAELEGLTADAILDRIDAARPALVGLSVTGNGSLPGAIAICEGVRAWAAPDAHITMGGVFPSAAPGAVLTLSGGPDSVVMGEGDAIAPLLAAAVVRGSDDWRDVPQLAWLTTAGDLRMNPAGVCPDLEHLGAPSRDLVGAAVSAGRAVCVSGSRGCGNSCSFCSVHGMYRNSGRFGWHGRPAAGIADELEMLASTHGVRDVVFVDDDFIGSHEHLGRAHEFSREVTRRNLDIWFDIETRPEHVDRDAFEALAAAGLRSVFVGVEAATFTERARLGKRSTQAEVENAITVLTDLGLHHTAGFIMFQPDAAFDSLAGAARFLAEHDQATPHALTNNLHVAPGTPIHHRLCREGRLTGDAIRGFEYRYADSRVATAFAVAQAAIRPLFPIWYAHVQSRARELTRTHEMGVGGASETLMRAEAARRGVQNIAHDTFMHVIGYVESGGRDTVRAGIELRDAALEAVRTGVPTPREVARCASVG